MLTIEDLAVAVRSKGRWLPILQDVNLTVGADETLAIVGESGSGKSMLALAITRLLAPAASFAVSGRIAFEGRDLLALSPKEMAQARIRRSPYSTVRLLRNERSASPTKASTIARITRGSGLRRARSAVRIGTVTVCRPVMNPALAALV